MNRRIRIWLASGSLLAFMPLSATAQAADTPAEQRQEIRQDVQRELDDVAKDVEEAAQEVADEAADRREDIQEEMEEAEERRQEVQEDLEEAADGDEAIDWPQRLRDGTTTARIETLFMMNDGLSAMDINTTTRDGVVTLEGVVADNGERQLAEDLARSLDNVTDVDNQLRVETGAVAGNAPQNEALPDRNLRGRVSDANLAATVRNRIGAHDRIDGPVNVRSEEGTIYLSGQVRSEEQKDLAEDLASEIRGVRDVENELEVRTLEGDDVDGDGFTNALSDEWAEKRVEQAIAFSSNVSIWDLDVEVDNGVCVLSGTVPSAEAKKLAHDIALDTRGVDEVVNNIAVSGSVGS